MSRISDATVCCALVLLSASAQAQPAAPPSEPAAPSSPPEPVPDDAGAPSAPEPAAPDAEAPAAPTPAEPQPEPKPPAALAPAPPGATPQQAAAAAAAAQQPPPIETWGAVEPGRGFLLGRTKYGDLSISAYALIRYINQLPEDQTFVDHLGETRDVNTRHDIYAHRVMVFLKGWLGLPKLRYVITLWTVNTTNTQALLAVIGYQFHRAFSLYAGLNALPGTRSLQGSHPYWLGHDRVMADEFFRPYFTHGIWATGMPVPGLWYTVMVGNNLSAIGVTAAQLTREMAAGASVWLMPTTGEFGPQGAFGDFEMHDELATRFGVSGTRSREDRFSNVLTGSPDNVTIRLADSLNLFNTGSLAPDVTVQLADYKMLAIDAGMKYRGLFLQAEYYNRWLNDFDADGPLPVSSIHDTGFYVQLGFYPLPRLLELYGATSQIFGDKSAGFKRSYEYLGGANFYPADTRNIRLNLQGIYVHRSPAAGTFGYYAGGQKGVTLTGEFSIFF